MNTKRPSTSITVFATLRSRSLLNILLTLALLLFIAFAPLDGWTMPPGWANGCLRPSYGSPEAACSTLLNDFVTSFVINLDRGFCEGIGSNGSPAGFMILCADCPKGYAVDHNQCVAVPGFDGPDPYADVGSQGQPAPAADQLEIDPLGGDSCPGGDPILVADPALVGNPINARTGNKYQREIDYVGAGVFPLSFVRHYNSRLTLQSQLGLGWRHNYDRQIMAEDPARVVLVRANGQALEFKLSGGVWSSAIDVTDKLRRTSNGWQLTTSVDEIETYDAGGRLISIANRAGLTQRLTYSTPDTPGSIAPRPGLLLSVSDPAGRQLKFTYDSHFRMRTMTDPAGNVFVYGYVDNPTLLSTVSYPGDQNAKRTYLYAFARINPVLGNALTGIVDENGQAFATYTYDPGTGRATGSSHGGALAADPYTLTYNANGTTSVADANVSRTYNFQTVRGIARVTGISQPCSTCGSSSLAGRVYDSNGFATSGSDFNGNVTIYQRNDPLGRVELQTARTEAVATPEARTITTEWDPSFRLVRRVAEPLRITTITYDEHANVQSRTIHATTDTNGALAFSASLTGEPRTWNYAYTYSDTIPGQVARLVVDGPRIDVADSTTYNWDLSGNLTSVTNALGHTTTLGNYDAHGRPQQIIDPNGLAITLSYDTRGRLLARNSGGELTSYDYDAAGQLKTLTFPDGSSLSYTYDPAHRLTQIQDNLGDQIRYTLDAMGNRIQEQVFDPSGTLARSHTREFNALSRLAKDIGATDPANQITQYAYDNQGNVVSVADPLGHITARVYDALNRVAKVIDPAAIGSGAGASTRYSYDGADQLTQLTDPRGLTTAYELDGLGNVTARASPDTGVTRTSYDEAGNLTAQTDAREAGASFTYDALNRIKRAEYTSPPGSGLASVAVLYSYDEGDFALGRLTRITDSSGSISYAYDIHGRLIRDIRTIAGVDFATAYRYDMAGRLTGMTYPSGRTVDYTLDASGRIGQIDTTDRGVSQSIVSTVAYQPFGPLRSFTYGNAQKATRQYDLDGRTTRYSLGSLSRSVSYDASSRITAFKHPTPALDQTFTYDNVDRITGWSTLSTSQTFAYDAVGNRTNQSVDGRNFVSSYFGTSNRLMRSEFPIGFNYQYDAAGNTTQDALRSYTYDARSRLTRIVAGGLTIQFAVNALGQRVSKAPSNGLPRLFHYDVGGHLIVESTPAGEVLREYLYLGDLPVALISNDHDDDGVPDARDNCVLDSNADQRDNSGFGYGNVCNGDTNGDGLLTQADLNLLVLLAHSGRSNPAAAKRGDMNGDGILDYRDEALLSQRIRQRGVLGPSGKRGQVTGPEVFYVYSDQTGAPRTLVDSLNKVRWRWDVSDPFGIQPGDEAPQGDFISLPFNLRFPGQYYDRESGLHYNYFRDYDPTTGRYVTVDPIELAGGQNGYAYVNSDPVSYIDPFGLVLISPFSTEDMALGGGGGVGGGGGGASYGSGIARSPLPAIKAGSAGGPTGGQRFPQSVIEAAKAGNPGAICVYCRRPGTGKQVDHAIPRAKNGNATIENAQLACPHCNPSKGARNCPVNPPPEYVGPWPPPWWEE